MRLSTRQLVLALILWAAWLALGGNRAQASYVSTVGWNNPDDTLIADLSGSGDGGMAAERSDRSSSGDTHWRYSSESLIRFAHLFRTAWHTGFDGGAGSSTNTSSSVNGPTSPPVGAMARVDFSLPESIGLLPPQTGDVHTFSISSSLFRPPRHSWE